MRLHNPSTDSAPRITPHHGELSTRRHISALISCRMLLTGTHRIVNPRLRRSKRPIAATLHGSLRFRLLCSSDDRVYHSPYPMRSHATHIQMWHILSITVVVTDYIRSREVTLVKLLSFTLPPGSPYDPSASIGNVDYTSIVVWKPARDNKPAPSPRKPSPPDNPSISTRLHTLYPSHLWIL